MTSSPIDIDRIAEQYVRLVLAIGRHDADFVDAYYGPEDLAASELNSSRLLPDIREEAQRLVHVLDTLPSQPTEEIVTLRQQYLRTQMAAIAARASILNGTRMSFDEEAKALYDVIPSTYPEAHFQSLLHDLESLIPGSGPLPARVEHFRKRFTIPTDRLDTVFQAAIAECRSRTRKHIALPPQERFEIEYVKDKSWSGYNWFKGNAYSLIQINTDLPIFLDRAIDLAAHEGYPGHHVYNALLEQELVRKRRWVEFSIYALFSPQSLIAEGTANFGIEVVLPGSQRLEFDQTVLAPLAGIDPAAVPAYAQLQALVAKLSYAGNEAARAYLDGAMTREEAADWLVRYALMSPERALQRTKFFDQYRSYVINYNLGQDIVKRYIEARGGTVDAPQRRWDEFVALLSTPRSPSGLMG
ncbi:MAG: hypothetical protein MUF82_02265 [Bacteroidetes bacterium]|jgi:hypothetical protein|nr:hypothetical protein [Bacteroidota bacterium]